jgi:hypothetical protein
MRTSDIGLRQHYHRILLCEFVDPVTHVTVTLPFTPAIAGLHGPKVFCSCALAGATVIANINAIHQTIKPIRTLPPVAQNSHVATITSRENRGFI